MKTHTFFLAVLSILSSVPYVGNAASTQISGTVISTSKEPLPGATVQLLHAADSSFAYGTGTDANGSYAINAQPGRYILAASMIGFEQQQIAVDVQGSQPITLAPITLSAASVSIKEVTVVGHKSTIEYEAGKTILNPNEGAVHQPNAFEALKGVPGLIVNEDGTFILNGQKGVTVQVNGKDTYLSGVALANLLKSTPTNTVEKIEVITTPTAEYDASGKSGIINIRLKKNSIEGYNLQSNIEHQQGNDGREFLWARASMRQKRTGYAVDFSHNHGDKAKDGYIYREHTDSEIINGRYSEASRQETFLINRDNSNNLRAIFDFDITKKLSTNIDFSGNNFHRTIPGGAYTSFDPYSSAPDSLLNTDTESNYRQTTLNGGIHANYNDGDKFEADLAIDGLAYKHKETSYLYSEMISSKLEKPRLDSLWGKLDGDIKMIAIKGNITKSVGSNAKVQAGFKSLQTKIDNKSYYTSPAEGQHVLNTRYSSKYDYTERVDAAYVQAGAKYRRWGIIAGLRCENATIDGTTYALSSDKDNLPNSSNYLSLFPSGSILYGISDNQNLSLSYTRRITRPNYKDLSPFDYMVDEYTIIRGNPDLKPEFTNNIELAYVFGKSYRASLIYITTSNILVQGFGKLDNGGLLIVPRNLASSRCYAAKLDAGKLIDLKWCQTNASILAYRIKHKWQEGGSTHTCTQTTPMLNFSSQFYMPHKWGAQLSGYYNGRISMGMMSVPAAWSINCGINKKAFNDMVHIYLYALDIFSSIREIADIRENTINARTDIRYDETSVGLAIYININRGKIKDSKRQDNNIEESKRINF